MWTGRWVRRWAAVVGGLAVLAACASSNESTVDVFAAASLADAFAEIERAYEARVDDVDVRLNFGGSSTLREQLLDGAEADVFASANMAVMQDLVIAGSLDPGAPVPMATNHLVLAVAAGNPLGISRLADLEDDELLIGLCARGVPCGDLARRWLDGQGIEAALDTAEPDVRALNRRLAEGELDAALVYATDVRSEAGSIEAVPLADADGGSGDAVYPIVALTDEGDDFVAFVVGPSGRDILSRWGFGAP